MINICDTGLHTKKSQSGIFNRIEKKQQAKRKREKESAAEEREPQLAEAAEIPNMWGGGGGRGQAALVGSEAKTMGASWRQSCPERTDKFQSL